MTGPAISDAHDPGLTALDALRDAVAEAARDIGMAAEADAIAAAAGPRAIGKAAARLRGQAWLLARDESRGVGHRVAMPAFPASLVEVVGAADLFLGWDESTWCATTRLIDSMVSIAWVAACRQEGAR